MYKTTAFARKSKEDKSFYKIEQAINLIKDLMQDIERNTIGDNDIEFDIKFCGVCHSDVHMAEEEFGQFLKTNYPCVPGHELAGIATKVGKNVKKVKVGDKVGVGTSVDSCMDCRMCDKSEEQYCEKGHTGTYNSKITHGRVKTNTGYTFGGYSSKMTVPERFIVKIPDAYNLEAAGPVFCAGITLFSPLKHWGAMKGGMNIGIVGIGGLGQMGVRLAKAMGNTVTAISTSPHKAEVAKKIGATNFVVSTSEESMKAAANSLDLILNTVSANHDCGMYLPLLRVDGVLVQLGAVLTPHSVSQLPLMMQRKSIAGSIVGGMADTQELIDFCQKHKIEPQTQLITYDELPKVYDLLSGKNDSITRYVLDIEKSCKKA